MRLLLLCSLVIVPLCGEIESAIISFRQELCNTDPCLRTMQQRFEAVKEIDQVIVTPGQVQMTWTPGVPFSFQKINQAARLAGIGSRADTMVVTVRGTISKEGNNYYLTSLGDKTRFRLLNPQTPGKNNLMSANNIENFHLLPDVKKQLDEAIKGKQIMRTSGALFAPWRYELTILMTHLSGEKPPTPAPYNVRGGKLQNIQLPNIKPNSPE